VVTLASRAAGAIAVTSTPRIIAHRGDVSRFPENTLQALRAAAQAGADGVELDIQFSAEGTPVVFHDRDLKRMTDHPGLVRDFPLGALKQLSAHEPARWGTGFEGTRIATLEEIAEGLSDHPAVTVFIEIKRDSLLPSEIPGAVQRVLAASERLGRRRVIISFEGRVLRAARSMADLPVGWVIERWTFTEMSRAEILKPDYLFCERRTLPPSPAKPWPGPWKWVVYEVNEPEEARSLAARGIDSIETGNVVLMVSALKQRDAPAEQTTQHPD